MPGTGLKHNFALSRHDKGKQKQRCSTILKIFPSIQNLPQWYSQWNSILWEPWNDVFPFINVQCKHSASWLWPAAIQNQCLWVKPPCPDWNFCFQPLWIQVTVLGTASSPGNDHLCIDNLILAGCFLKEMTNAS